MFLTTPLWSVETLVSLVLSLFPKYKNEVLIVAPGRYFVINFLGLSAKIGVSHTQVIYDNVCLSRGPGERIWKMRN